MVSPKLTILISVMSGRYQNFTSPVAPTIPSSSMLRTSVPGATHASASSADSSLHEASLAKEESLLGCCNHALSAAMQSAPASQCHPTSGPAPHSLPPFPCSPPSVLGEQYPHSPPLSNGSSSSSQVPDGSLPPMGLLPA